MDNIENKQPFSAGKIVLIVILVLVAAAIILVIGYYVGKNTRGNSTAKTTATPTASAVASKTKTAVALATATSATASWKTYKSSQYNYQVKYPSSWVADEKDASAISFYTVSNMAELKRLEEEQIGTEGPLSEALVVYYANLADADGSNPPRYSSLDEMVHDAGTYRDTVKTTFAGQQAYQTIEGGMVDFFEYVLEKDGHIYKIMIPDKTSKASLDSTEQSFLSGFEFTN